MASSHRVREVNIESALAAVRSLIDSAERSVEALARQDCGGGDDWMFSHSASRDVETAFTQLMILTDVLGLTHTYKQICKAYKKASNQDHGLPTFATDPDGDIHLLAAATLRRFVASLEGVFGLNCHHVVSKNVVEVLRATQYTIIDQKCFPAIPTSESDVHHRVEAVLKCIFPDLLHTPPIQKPVKNFKPDTGLPSIRTLIEYKFIQSKADIGQIADEILADTRGYESRDWNAFIFMIYETCRLKPEREWNALLRECGTAINTQAIVICGEPPPPNQATAKSESKAKKQKPAIKEK